MEEQDLKQIANCSSNIFSPHYSVLFFFFKPWLLYLHKCPLARIAKSLIEASFYFQGSRRFLSFPGGVTSTSFIFCDGDFHRRHSSETNKRRTTMPRWWEMLCPVCLPWEVARHRQLGLGLQAFGHCTFWLMGYTGGISLPVLSVLASLLALEIFFQAMGLSKLQTLQNPSMTKFLPRSSEKKL